MHDVSCIDTIRFTYIRACIKNWIEFTSQGNDYYRVRDSISTQHGMMCPLFSNWIDVNINLWSNDCDFCCDSMIFVGCMATSCIPVIVSGGCFGLECGACYCCGCCHPTSNGCVDVRKVFNSRSEWF